MVWAFRVKAINLLDQEPADSRQLQTQVNNSNE